MKKGIIRHPKLSILWTTRLSSHSFGFSKLTVLLWMMAIVFPLHHRLALIFCVVMPSGRLGLSVLSYRKSDRIDLSKGLELAFLQLDDMRTPINRFKLHL